MADNFFEALKTKFGKAFSTQDKQSDYKKEELDSLKSIMDELDHLPTEEARYLAVFSFILFHGMVLVERLERPIPPVTSQKERRNSEYLSVYGGNLI